MQLLQMNYVPKHSRNHTDSELLSYARVYKQTSGFIYLY